MIFILPDKKTKIHRCLSTAPPTHTQLSHPCYTVDPWVLLSLNNPCMTYFLYELYINYLNQTVHGNHTHLLEICH